MAVGILIVGEGWYGAIEAFEETSVATRMVHFFFVPIAPVGGALVYRDAMGKKVALPTVTDTPSAIAAYLRWWSPASFLAIPAAAAMAPALVPVAAVGATVAVAAAHIGARRIGRVDE